MDYSKIFSLIVALGAKIQQDFEDKKITVAELLDVVKTVVYQLGIADTVVIDLSKKEEEKNAQG